MQNQNFNKFTGLLIIAIAILITPNLAKADEDFDDAPPPVETVHPWYVSGHLMAMLTKTDRPSVVTTAPVAFTNDLSDYPDYGIGADIAIGYDWYETHNFPLRTELEAFYMYRHDVDFRQREPGFYTNFFSNASAVGLMANVIYDFHLNGRLENFRPWVGAGIGASYNMSDADRFLSLAFEENQSNSSLEFNYQASAGLAWDFAETWAAEIGYRYHHMGDTASITFIDGEHLTANGLSAHEIIFGIVKRF